jgi:hypothetical protein
VEWAVSLRINSTAVELPFDVSVPKVLYFVSGSSWQIFSVFGRKKASFGSNLWINISPLLFHHQQ